MTDCDHRLQPGKLAAIRQTALTMRTWVHGPAALSLRMRALRREFSTSNKYVFEARVERKIV